MYPLKFYPIYKEKIWGGTELKSFRNDVPLSNIGESWEISCHPESISVVSNGEFKGMKFDELLKLYSNEILGMNFTKTGFQLLVKIINSNKKLSLQVHPDDKYSRKYENQNGKNEIWYVMDAKKDAELVLGFKNCDKTKFLESLKNNTVEQCFNREEVKNGDVYYVKAGLVHAICAGNLIIEIQQSSDITYRIYDYGRDRELHLDRALDVIDYKLKSPLLKGKTISMPGYEQTDFIKTKYFTLEKIKVIDQYKSKSDDKKYFIFICVDGNGEITYNGNNREEFNKGDSILIPALLGDFRITGNIEFLKVYV